jgi:hypothetical protein
VVAFIAVGLLSLFAREVIGRGTDSRPSDRVSK